MTWVKLDDQFPDHPKVIEAGPSAAWLYVCGLAYSSRYLTDGFISTAQAKRLASGRQGDGLIDRLVMATLWEVVDGGYQIHDFLDYNPSAEKVRETRAIRQKVGQVGGRHSGETRRASLYIEATTKQIASPLVDPLLQHFTNNVEAKSNPVPVPVPLPHKAKEDPSTETRSGESKTPRVTLDDEPYLKLLVTKYGDVYSEEEVRDIVAAARGHPNYRKRDDKQSYVNNWILRDAKPLRERAKRWGNSNDTSNHQQVGSGAQGSAASSEEYRRAWGLPANPDVRGSPV